MTVERHRRRHDDVSDLAKNLLGTARSALHHLTATELNDLVGFIVREIPTHTAVTEGDRWRIWQGFSPQRP